MLIVIRLKISYLNSLPSVHSLHVSLAMGVAKVSIPSGKLTGIQQSDWSYKNMQNSNVIWSLSMGPVFFKSGEK